MSGFSELGAALGGLDQSQANAYQTGMLRGAQGADLLEQARQRRNQNLALAAITPEKIAAAQADPTGPGSYDLAAALIQADRDPRQIAEYGKTEQGIGWGNQAMTAATAPNADLNLLNRINMVRNGKPVDLSKVEGNTLISPMVTPGLQASLGGNVPTAVGQSDITAALARAGASNASAARQYAGIGADKAANHDIVANEDGILVNIDKLTGKSAPVLDTTGNPLKGSPKGGKGGDGTVPPTMYEAVLGKPLATGKPNPMQLQFQNFMALHPELSDIEGLRQFARASQNTPTGNFGDPKNPESSATYTTPASIGDALGSPTAPAIPTISPVPASLAEALNTAATAKPVPGGVNSAGDYTPPAVPPAALQYLKANAGDPAIRAAFKQKYGVDPSTLLGN